MKLASVATETVAIIERGDYRAPSGATISVRSQVDAAIAGTLLYAPGALDRSEPGDPSAAPPRVEVTAESTAAAGRRLVEAERIPRVVALNFASARNPGGGFLRGAKAQEEDLARCSALYPCLTRAPRYYEVNRACTSLIYTDHIIYSPDVPFFRDERLTLLEAPFLLSIITAPAPNAGEELRRDKDAGPLIHSALERRAARVLAAAAAHGHRCLVLGAWGCGVFRNDPGAVADVFARWLENPRFRGAFDRVVFAIYDRSPGQATLRAFEQRLTGAADIESAP
jgi:uncharacterized protein (TIGR02452 family)